MAHLIAFLTCSHTIYEKRVHSVHSIDIINEKVFTHVFTHVFTLFAFSGH